MRNLLGLVLDDTLVRSGDRWWIQIPAAQTKTKEPIELDWPEALTEPLESYLAHHRVVLAQNAGASSHQTDGALWLSADGLPMTRNRAYVQITARTREGLGRSINPHLFRDCAATSIAIEDPGHVGIASRLLGHRAVSTTERYYNQAHSIEASRLMQQHILALRNGTTPVSVADRAYFKIEDIEACGKTGIDPGGAKTGLTASVHPPAGAVQPV